MIFFMAFLKPGKEGLNAPPLSGYVQGSRSSTRFPPAYRADPAVRVPGE
jgi:hypothetical protein